MDDFYSVSVKDQSVTRCSSQVNLQLMSPKIALLPTRCIANCPSLCFVSCLIVAYYSAMDAQRLYISVIIKEVHRGNIARRCGFGAPGSYNSPRCVTLPPGQRG